MSYLVILKGPNAGERHELDRAWTFLGRSHECQVLLRALDDGTGKYYSGVSRKHAVITRSEDGQYFLEDPSRPHRL